MLPETRLLLSQWDSSLDIDANLLGAQMENTIGKASRNRVKRVLAAFRRRYASKPDVLNALVVLSHSAAPMEILDRVLFFCASQDDPLIMDAAVSVLAPACKAGRREIAKAQMVAWLDGLVEAGLTVGEWSPPTIVRVAEGLLSTLRDFGLLEGSTKKQLRSVFMPAETCAFISFLLYQSLCSGHLVVHSPSWQAFLMESLDVERMLIEAAGRKLLQYNAAGSVIRIDFPVESAEEYARVIIERQN